MSDTLFPVLYILMRVDLPSMNAGKGMAQASHASNAFIKNIKGKKAKLCSEDHDGEVEKYRDQIGLADIWELETPGIPQGFGTVLVLGVTKDQMYAAVQVADMLGFTNGVVNDPTSPYQTTAEIAALIDPNFHTLEPAVADDRATLFRSEDTCAYIFGDKNDKMLAAVVGNFPLHP